jgi:hypothetical protein
MVAGIWRRIGLLAACACAAALAAPGVATAALSTHSASDSKLDSNGQLVATAKCGANEHVVSGGFNTPNASQAGGEVVSRAVGDNRWTVHLYAAKAEKLTTYAYCAPNGKLSLSERHKQVAAQTGTPTYNTVATARCGSRATAVSGGFALSRPASQSDSTTFRDYASGTNKWTVMSAFSEPTGATLTSFAHCAKGVVVKVHSATSDSIPSLGHASATATCPKGQTLLSGGFTTEPTPDYNNLTGPDMYFSRSYRSGLRSWTVTATNYANVTAGTITAFAYCMP